MPLNAIERLLRKIQIKVDLLTVDTLRI